jgi:diguanylate cyclase (GGDEF)-like protein
LAIFEDLINEVCRTREPILTVSKNNDEYMQYNIGSALCIPLIAKGQLIGISVAAHENHEALNDESLAYLSSIFNQVSIAVENAQLYREMKEIAERDGLTKVYNRAYFQQKFAELKSKSGIKHLAVTILDIDCFKRFNDTYGHQFGDIVLKEVANISRKFLVEGEFVSRYGGEEFVIIFENKSEHYVMKKVEKIRRIIEETKVSDDKFTASVTASFGVAFYPTTYNGIDEHLLTCADDALYESKKNGRNQVTLSKDE